MSELEETLEMVVKRIDPIPVEYPEPNDNNRTRRLLLCRIECDDGTVGWGEAVTTLPEVTLATKAVVEGLSALVIGRDPLDNQDIWRKIKAHTHYYGNEGIAAYALSAIDIALWDLKGKILGVPLVQLLGGAHSHRLPVIASTIAIHTELEAEAERQGEYIRRGYRGVKVGFHEALQLGSDVERDISFMAMLREAVGPNAEIMIDRNRCQFLTWDLASAIKRTNGMEQYGLYWIEDAFEPTNLHDFHHFRSAVNTLIATGEREWLAADYERLIASGVADVFLFDPGRSEGITGGQKVIQIVEDHHRWIDPHSWSSAINTAAALALCASTPRCLVFEMKAEPNPMQHELVESPFEQHDGWIDVPSKPGLGIEVIEEAVEKYRFQGGA
jgi:L-alanine-DL-glutamate epimerase-like enolase superfamily enzyme